MLLKKKSERYLVQDQYDILNISSIILSAQKFSNNTTDKKKDTIFRYNSFIENVISSGGLPPLEPEIDGEYDAIILACAGLIRLGFEKRIKQQLNSDQSLPAVGQGALGIEIRGGDESIRKLLEPLIHERTLNEVMAERSMNSTLEGGCSVAIGGYSITMIQTTQQQAGQPSTITLENSYTFNLVSNASSTETGGGIQVLAGPLDTKQG